MRERFRGGHKAFLWSWLDHYNPDDVRILIHPLDALQLQRNGKGEILAWDASRADPSLSNIVH